MNAILPLLLACWRDCPPVDDAALATLPTILSETGLYSDAAMSVPNTDVIAYTPRFALWADGADKSRWISLPAGEVIDAADVDQWRFPEGTRAWKEFAVDGKRLETRVIDKTGPGDDEWIAVAYQWDEDGLDAAMLPDGAEDVGGTDHDIPGADDCVGCHGGRASFLLGFSAVQLSGAEPYSLEALVAAGGVAPTPGALSQPTEADTAALGYLHANCSHCHNPERPDIGPACYSPDGDVDFTLPAVAITDVHRAPALDTASEKLSPGKPEESEVLRRMSDRVVAPWPQTMPPLASEVVDDDAVAMVREWVEGL